MKKSIILIFCALAMVGSLNSCATLFSARKNAVAISSQPSGADVYVNGFKRGHTPIQLNLKADQSYNIQFRKKGYETITRVINTKVGAGWVVLDILGGVIPVVIDAATGAWKRLDQKTINAALEKQQ